MVSLLVSFTLTPMLCARFLTDHARNAHQTQRGIYGAIERAYGARPALVAAPPLGDRCCSRAVMCVSTVPLFGMVGKDFMPHDDQSEFEVIVQTPEGFSLERTDEALRAHRGAARASCRTSATC